MPSLQISDHDHSLLKALARQTRVSMRETLHLALDAYHRRVILDGINAGYAALKADPVAWAEELEERRILGI